MIIISILGAIAAIFIVVLIHELGHFTVARLLHVKVTKFSIGFGKAIWSYTPPKSGIEYAIGIIPLGGYVKMLGEQPDQIEDEALRKQSYSAQPVWSRMAIALAGPLANIILAIVAFLIVYLLGVTYVKPVIGKVVPQSIAAKANLQPGAQIIQIGKRDIYGWQQVMTSLLAHIGDSKKVSVITLKDHQKSQHWLDLSQWTIKKRTPDIIGSLGFIPYRVPIPAVVKKVMPQSPAARGGMQANDRIVKINGKPVTDWLDVLRVIRHHADKTVTMTVNRKGLAGKQLTVHVGVADPKAKQKIGHIGAEVLLPKLPPSMLHIVRYGFFESIAAGATRTWNLFTLNLKILGKMFTGAVSVNTLGGPISIFKTAGQASQAGWSVYLSFIGFVSVALAFINLLPIPMLDGGHVFFQLIEVVTRKPVPMRYQILGVKIGIVLILWLMVQATINDILRLV